MYVKDSAVRTGADPNIVEKQRCLEALKTPKVRWEGTRPANLKMRSLMEVWTRPQL